MMLTYQVLTQPKKRLFPGRRGAARFYETKNGSYRPTHEDYKRLGIAVLMQAVRDAKSQAKDKAAERLQAIEWLKTGGLDLAELCEIDINPAAFMQNMAALERPKTALFSNGADKYTGKV